MNLGMQHSRSPTFVYYAHAAKLICTCIQNYVRAFRTEKMHSSMTTLCYQQRKAMVTVQTWLAPACILEWRHCLRVKCWRVMVMSGWSVCTQKKVCYFDTKMCVKVMSPVLTHLHITRQCFTIVCYSANVLNNKCVILPMCQHGVQN